MSSWQSSIPYSIILSAATSRASVCRMYRRPVLAVLRAVPVDWLYSHRRRRRRTRKPTVDTTASFITRQSTVVMLLQSLCAYASFTGGGRVQRICVSPLQNVCSFTFWSGILCPCHLIPTYRYFAQFSRLFYLRVPQKRLRYMRDLNKNALNWFSAEALPWGLVGSWEHWHCESDYDQQTKHKEGQW